MMKYLRKSPTIIMILSIILSASLLIYKIDIHSDILFLDYFMQDMLSEHGHWRYWRFSPAPSYFPDMMLYAFAYFILPTAPLRIFFVTLAQIFLLSYLGNWLVNKLSPNTSLSMKLLVQFFLLIAIVAANHTTTNIGIFFNANDIQVPTAISSLLLLGLYISFLDRPQYKIAFWLLLIGGLAQASSAIFLINFVGPCFLMLISVIAIAKIQKNAPLFNKGLQSLFILFSSQIFGAFLSFILTYNSPLNGRAGLHLGAIKRAVHAFIDGTANLLDPSNLYSFLAFLTFSITVLYALYNSIKLILKTIALTVRHQSTEMTDLKLLSTALFLIFSTILSILGAIISGAFADIYGYRYFMTFIAIASILTGIFIEKNIKAKTLLKFGTHISILSIIIATISAVPLFLTKDKRGLHEISHLGAIHRTEEDIAHCLDDIMASGVNLYSGVSDFWYSRAVRFYLNNRLYIQPTLNNLEPFFWISSADSIIEPKNFNIEKYNFVILKNEEYPSQFSYDIQTMENVLPKEFTIHTCKQADVKILIYEHHQLDEKIKRIFNNFKAVQLGIGDLFYSAAQMPSQTGIIIGDTRRADELTPAGFIIFGPYITLKKGNYVLELDLTPSSTPNKNLVARLDIGRFDKARSPTVLREADILSSDQHLSIPFTVPRKGIKKLETRIYFMGNGVIQVNSITIKKLIKPALAYTLDIKPCNMV